MRVSAKQILATVVSTIITLTILWIGQKFYISKIVRAPLIQQVSGIAGVSHVSIGPSGAVSVKMDPGANLLSVSRAVSASVTHALGHPPRSLTFNSHPNGVLTGLASRARFMVAQGVATGQYVSMRQTILQAAKSDGVQALVELGNHHVYLTLRQGHAALYLIMPLTTGGRSGA